MIRLRDGFRLRVLASVLYLLFQQITHAGVAITWQSDFGGVNRLSDGLSPMTSSFTFELGTFSNDFIPSNQNRASWEDHWVSLQSAPYSETASAFSNVFNLQNNEFPFVAGGKAFIWGYNTRDVGGEWILLSDDAWTWPAATTGAPTPGAEVFFLVADISTDEAIVGIANDSDVQMMTALSPLSFAEWVLLNFTEEQRLEENTVGSFDDPDQDSIVNLLEYAVGGNPLLPDSSAYLSFEIESSLDVDLVVISVRKSARASVSWVLQASQSLVPNSFVPVENDDIQEMLETPILIQWKVRFDVEDMERNFFRVEVSE